MKKLLALLMAATMALSLCACGGSKPQEQSASTPVEEPPVEEISPGKIINEAQLQYPASNDLFKYNIYDTYVEITEYIGPDDAAEVIVPAVLEDLPVYVIDHGVFDRAGVKSIVFEEGIYKIHSGFSHKLVSVTLPSTLDYVGYGTFENCYSLETVVIPEGIDSLQTKAFSCCSALKEITIPSTVSWIDSELLSFCSSLETVNLSAGITRIRDKAFVGCESLKNLVIPNTVEEIGYHAFQGTALEYIEIPESVEKIHSGAFTACESLKEVKVYNADMQIIPADGLSVALLFSQCPEDLVVHGKPASTIAQACATENVYFKVIQ